MAEVKKKPRKTLSGEARNRKRESNRARDRTRVSQICKSDAELALDKSVITYKLSCYVLCCAHSMICINDSGVKVNYTATLGGAQ